MGEESGETRKSVTMGQKASDLKASGVVLVATGSIGFLGVVLWGLNVIPMRMQGIMKYISVGVMGFLFLVFLISGFNALKRSKSAAADAVRENEKREEILKWFLSEYTAEKIDEAIAAGETEAEEASGEAEAEEASGEIPEDASEEEEITEEPEEDIDAEDFEGSGEDDESDEIDDDAEPDENELYFERTGFIGKKISERFLEVDEALLSDIIESLYSEIFG